MVDEAPFWGDCINSVASCVDPQVGVLASGFPS
jgi:hypothetical protein